MIDTSEVNVYKITNLIANNARKAIDSFSEYLNVEHIKRDQLHQFEIDENKYTLIITGKELFDNDDLAMSYFVIFDGHFNDLTELKLNKKSILLSFPIFLVDMEEITEKDKKDALLFLKKIYIDESRNSPRHFFINPKFISLSEKILPILNIFEKYIKDNIIEQYKKERNQAINNFIFSVNELKNAIIEGEKSKGYEYYVDMFEPPLFISVNDSEVWVKLRDGHADIIAKKDSEYSIWYINRDDFNYEVFDLSIENIKENKEAFVKWLFESHDSPEMVLSVKDDSSSAIYDEAMQDTLNSTFRTLANSILSFQEYCGFKVQSNIIKNAEQLLTYNLGYESYKNMIGWMLFGQTSFKWTENGIKDKHRVIPYSILDKELPMYYDNKLTEVASQLSYTDGLIFNIPDNVHESFKPHIKKGYEMLKNNEFPMVDLTGVKLSEIEDRLKKLTIL